MIAESPQRDDVCPDLDEIVAAYLKAVDAGQSPDRSALLAHHLHVASELAAFFADLDRLERMAAPLRAVRSGSAAPSLPGAASETVDDPRRTTPYVPSGEPATSAAPSRGAEIPGYEVLGILGRGGMGVVYKARQVRLKRLVALKMIRAGSQAADVEIARFRVEAEAVARLQHPHIVQIYEVGDFAGQPFCSLEYVAGGTLAARLAGTPQPPREAAALARTLAEAVEAAHQRGIVHRDLKPANVLLTEEGWPKITDFGLAKCLDEDTGQTATGAVMGTPAYMAPEQALGQREVGPLADVYALGAILYEMLTGRPPFKAATVLETLDQVRAQEPVPVRLLQPKVPRDLETICLKCLAKDPHKRYASAGALADDLGRWLDGRPIKARRTPPWERAYRWVGRNRVMAALIALAAIGFIGGFAGVAWQWQEARAALAEAKGTVYLQRVNLADREILAGNHDRAEVLLDLCPEELRHWEWYYLKRRCHGNWVRFVGHTDLVRCVAFSADGQRLASCGNDRTVRLWDAATGRELLALGEHDGWVNAIVFHTDGQRLVSASEDGTIKVWGANGEHLRSHKYDFALQMTLSPDGRYFAILRSEGLAIHDMETGRALAAIPGRLSGHGKAVGMSAEPLRVAAALDGALRLWDGQTGLQVHLLQSLPQGAYNLTFSPDGRLLYSTQREARYPALRVWDTTNGSKIPDSLSLPQTVTVMALSPDGRSIATGGHEGVVKVRDTASGRDIHATLTFADPVGALAFQPNRRGLAVASGRVVWLRAWGARKDHRAINVSGHAGGVTSVAFSPDGRHLASCGEDAQVIVRDARTAEPVLTFSAPKQGYSVVGFSPDSLRLLAAGRDGAVYTWDLSNGQPGLLLRTDRGEQTDASFSPDGRRITTAGSDRAVRVWDAGTGQEVLTCDGHEASVWGVRFSPDGERLASASSDGTVRLWDASTGREALTLRGHLSHVQSVAFHPSGRLLATASTDETVRLWDMASGRVVMVLHGHTGPVRGLSFSPDGQRLASASEDGTVRLWDVLTGQEALSLPDPGNGKVRCVTFSPDGRRLATASSDGRVSIWDATPQPD